MLLVSLYCIRIESCAQYYQCLCIVFVLSLVPNITYVPGLNILDCSLVLSTSAQCYLCPWIEYSRLPLGSLC